MAKEIWDWMGKGTLVLEVIGDRYECIKCGESSRWILGEKGDIEEDLDERDWVITTQDDIEKGKDLMQKIDDTIDSVRQEQAMRKNEGKPQLSYIMDIMPALKDLVNRMEHGAKKYERNNWKKGFNKDQLIDSTLRHLSDFHEGKDIDEESGEDKLSNIGGALFNVVMLTYFYGSESEYWKEKNHE